MELKLLMTAEESSNIQRPIPEAHIVQEPYVIETGQIVQETTIAITDDMIKTYSIARTVKILTMIDIFFSFIYCLNNPWFFLPLIIAITGYYGAKQFKQNYICIYGVYIIIDAIFKTAVFFWVYGTLSNDEKAEHLFNVILIIFSFMISMWILDIVYKFYKNLEKLSIEQLEYLRETGIPRTRIVRVWY